MIERESGLPLAVGTVVAVLLHAALVPVWGVGLAGTQRTDATPPKQDRPLPEPQELDAGRAHASVSNVAWISYDDFHELLAEHSIVEQPALQKLEDPAPDAPIEMDPTPPTPSADPDALPSSPGSESGGSASLSSASLSQSPVSLPDPQVVGQMPYAPKGSVFRDAQASDADAAKQQAQPSDRPADDPGAPADSGKPTAAPKSDREAPPVTIIPGIKDIKPGKVLTGDGVEIKTVVPRPSVIAGISTIPKNPEATLTFNTKGEVVNVELTRSTGADNWDSPVRASLLKWTASGERFDELEGELKLKVRLLLRRE